MIKIEEKELLERCGFNVFKFDDILDNQCDDSIRMLIIRQINEKIIKLLKSFKNVEKIVISPLLNLCLNMSSRYRIVFEKDPVFDEVYKRGEFKITKYLILNKKIDICVDNFSTTNYMEIYERN